MVECSSCGLDLDGLLEELELLRRELKKIGRSLGSVTTPPSPSYLQSHSEISSRSEQVPV